MIDITEAKRILATFEREGVQYVMVGSMAMAAQGLVRATRDVGFFVSPTAGNVEALRRALKSLYQDDPNVDEIRAEDLTGDYPERYGQDTIRRSLADSASNQKIDYVSVVGPTGPGPNDAFSSNRPIVPGAIAGPPFSAILSIDFSSTTSMAKTRLHGVFTHSVS